VEFTESDLLKYLKKITNEQQLYNAPLLTVAFPVLQNFFIYDFFKNGRLGNFVSFFGFFRYLRCV
jgi:hypothetical protein